MKRDSSYRITAEQVPKHKIQRKEASRSCGSPIDAGALRSSDRAAMDYYFVKR
ncbi:MAG: hypothetical protein ACOYH0_08530 [Saccharofermentanales bacterium]